MFLLKKRLPNYTIQNDAETLYYNGIQNAFTKISFNRKQFFSVATLSQNNKNKMIVTIFSTQCIIPNIVMCLWQENWYYL